MDRKFLVLCIVLLGQIFFAQSVINAQITDNSDNKKINITPLTKLENEIFEEINFVRTKPAEYLKILEGSREYYKGNTFTAPGQKGILTTEGVTTLNEVIEELKVLKPLEPLAIGCAAVRASRDHLADLQKSGAFSHTGSDGSSSKERLEKYLNGGFQYAENITEISGTARDIVIMMLLDDGIPSRPHRISLLNPKLKFVGVSNGDNSKKLTLTVIDMSDSSADIEPCEMK